MNYDDLKKWSKLIKVDTLNKLPRIMAEDIVGVQPMTDPNGECFKITFNYLFGKKIKSIEFIKEEEFKVE